MSKIVYSGTMDQEFKLFEDHDSQVIGYLSTIAGNIAELNGCWNDEKSNTYLEAFNSTLNEIRKNVGIIHDEVEAYLSDVQNILNVWGGGSKTTLGALGTFTVTNANASSSGSINVDIDKVLDIVTRMRNTATEAKNCVDSFNPKASSLAGSSDDIISAVESNYNNAAKSYVNNLDQPLNDIATRAEEIQQMYESKATTINNSNAGTNGGGTGKDTVSYMKS